MKDKLKYKFNSNDFLFTIYSYRKPIIYIAIVAAVTSTIISFLITPKFKSTAVLFPAPTTSIAKSLIASNTYSKTESMFGEDKEVEQILQVLSSEDLQDKIVKKYDLVKHYDIDPKDKHLKSEIDKQYEKNISFGRTQYMAIEISVLDINPDTAAAIANDIASSIDSVMNRMEKDRAVKAFSIVKTEFEKRNAEFSILKDSLTKIMSFGVYDIESQAGSLSRVYAQALEKGNMKGAEKIQEKLNILAKYGGTFLTLTNVIKSQSEQLSLLNTKCKETQVDAEQTLTHFFVVDKAYSADKKSYPQRILIILNSTISSILLSILIVIIIEALRDFKQKDSLQKTQE